MKINSMFYIIKNSPWPILMTINLMSLFSQLILTSSSKTSLIMLMVIFLLTTMTTQLWNMNSNKEKTLLGLNNKFNEISIKTMMIILIISEMMFFLSFFYINFSNLIFMNTNNNMKYFNKMFKLNFILALLNLIILLTSSITMMMFIKNNQMNLLSNKYLMKTIMLSIYFISIQNYEYIILPMNSSNSMFMSNFFSLTLFHMSHVIMGTITMMMMTKLKMMMMNNLTKMVMTCWYWHFIDLIWIIIFTLIY